MKYKVFKKCNKNYEEIYTREKETKEVQLDLDKVRILITEHQCGIPTGETWIEIAVKDKSTTYCMSLTSFIDMVTTPKKVAKEK